MLKLIRWGGLIPNKQLHKHETYGLADKRKWQRCLWLLISHKHQPFSSEGRPGMWIQTKERQAEQARGERTGLSQNNMSSPRTGPIYNHKQPPRSHRGTSGKPLSSPLGQQILLGLNEALLAPLFCLGNTLKHTCAKETSMEATDVYTPLAAA